MVMPQKSKVKEGTAVAEAASCPGAALGEAGCLRRTETCRGPLWPLDSEKAQELEHQWPGKRQ